MSTAKITGYRLLGGIHPTTASLHKLFAFHGIHDSRTQKPYTESLLFGIGGGIGFAYRTKKSQNSEDLNVALYFSNRWKDTLASMHYIADRLGIKYEIFQSKSTARSDEALRNLLVSNQPVAYWLDRAVLPHYANIPRGTEEWVVNIVGIDGNVLTVDDISKRLLPVTHELIVETRKTMPALRNQFFYVTGSKKADTATAVKKGIRDCIDNLSHSTTGLADIKRWAELLVAHKPEGWPTLFTDPANLYVALEMIYEAVTQRGGGNLRDLYADFLEEAAEILNKPDLVTVAKQYKKIAKDWRHLGELALTDKVRDFSEAKELITEKYTLFYKEGPDAHKDLERIDTRLKDISDKNKAWLPLNNEEILLLFEQLSQQLEVIYKKEHEALDALKKAMR